MWPVVLRLQLCFFLILTGANSRQGETTSLSHLEEITGVEMLCQTNKMTPKTTLRVAVKPLFYFV